MCQNKEYEQKIEHYKDLTVITYDCAVAILLRRHGPVKANYYNEESYNNYLAKKSNNIKRGASSYLEDGLYKHHIFENKYENIGDPVAIRKHNYPYFFQEAQNLVYADLVEHMILHALIVKENMGIEGRENFGRGGYEAALCRNVCSWYIDSSDEDQSKLLEGRDKVAFERAYLAKKDAEEICGITNKLAGIKE